MTSTGTYHPIARCRPRVCTASFVAPLTPSFGRKRSSCNREGTHRIVWRTPFRSFWEGVFAFVALLPSKASRDHDQCRNASRCKRYYRAPSQRAGASLASGLVMVEVFLTGFRSRTRRSWYWPCCSAAASPRRSPAGSVDSLARTGWPEFLITFSVYPETIVARVPQIRRPVVPPTLLTRRRSASGLIMGPSRLTATNQALPTLGRPLRCGASRRGRLVLASRSWRFSLQRAYAVYPNPETRSGRV